MNYSKLKTILMFFAIFVLICLLPINISPAIAAQNQNDLPPTNIEFEHISVEDGLSSPIVYDIIQDNYGFIWIATANGLNKYDGYSITNYYPDPDDPKNPNTVSGNEILNIVLGSDGKIWIATDN